MSRPLVPPTPADPSESGQSLTERIMERVRQAGLAADEPLNGGSARPHRRLSEARRRRAADGRTPEQVREARSFRRVFLDMGDSYREYRRRTGAPIAPEVRDAADRFRRERSLTSLAAVAASLDELQILTW